MLRKGRQLQRYPFRGLSRVLKDDQIMKRSSLPSDFFQKSLPILKVPKLEDTVKRYLKSQEAILSPEKYEEAKASITAFSQNEGLKLQKELEVYASARPKSSYITEMWTDMYLKDRRPVVLTHQAVLIFNDSQKGGYYQNQAVRTTNLISSMLRFHTSLNNNILEPEVFYMNPKTSESIYMKTFLKCLPSSYATYGSYLFKAFPLDMSQYGNLFSSTRIPNPNKDKLVVNEKGRHVVVMRNGNIYYFDVLDKEGQMMSGEHILKNISFIINQPSLSKTPGADPDQNPNVGVLTAMNRDAGCKAREDLIRLGNGHNFEIIDSALFAVALNDTDHEDPALLLNEFLAGPAENRWFDKSITLLVDRMGKAALTFEHSWGDGVAVLRLFNDAFEDSEKRPVVHAEMDNVQGETVDKLIWRMNEEFVKNTIITGIKKYNDWRNDLDLNIFQVEGRLTRENCKVGKLSPDSMCQLAFQIAYYKIHNHIAPTYESCSTSVFKHGRTETLRSATVSTTQVVNYLKNKRITEASPELWKLLDNCSSHHNQLTKEAAMGQGWDRHLFAMKVLGTKSNNGHVPDFFANDKSYNWINNIILSTSSLNSDNVAMGGFAAPNKDGYGVGYMIRKDACGTVLTSWKSSEFVKLKLFAEALQETMEDLGLFIKDMKRPK